MITIVLCFFIIFFTYTAEETSYLHDIKKLLSMEIEELSSQVDELSEENITLKNEKDSLADLLFGLEDIETDIQQSQEEFIRYLREKIFWIKSILCKVKEGL